MLAARSHRRVRDGSAPPPVALAFLVLLVLSGLVWMHALGAVPATAGHASVAAHDPCAEPGQAGHCPDNHLDHPGPLCQSGSVTAAIRITAPGLAGLAAPATPRSPVPVSAATVAVEAGVGTGCGPPSLTMLSISRT